MPEDVATGVRALLGRALDGARTTDAAEELTQIRDRLDGPLRIAIAGKVKSGKSTLLNALLGEELAATDAGECTQIVTWYVESHTSRVQRYPRGGGDPSDCRFSRESGALAIDLGGTAPTDVDRLVVSWPSSRLRDLDLIDTPGIASISTEISERTHQVLAADEGRPPTADAILYLLRHAHSTDVRFLESFHDQDLAQGTPLNTVGVLSRADEIGSCRLDALDVAARIARRYETDYRLRRLCPIVVPVDSLLGYAAATLRESEYRAVAQIASATADTIAQALLTADRVRREVSTVDVPQNVRERLLARFGLFGVRVAVELVRTGVTPTASSLAEELARISGVDRLRTVVLRQFLDRSRVLKARSAISAVRDVLGRGGCTDVPGLRAHLEQVEANAHEFAELRLLSQLRSGAALLDAERTEQLERLIGGFGHDPATRLGLAASCEPPQLREAAYDALATWQRLAEHPLTSRPTHLAVRTAVRTIEGLLAVLPDTASGR